MTLESVKGGKTVDTRLNLTATVKDSITAESYISKLSDETVTRSKYSAQGFAVSNGTVDYELCIDDMIQVKDIVLFSNQPLKIKFDGLTTYQILNEAQTSTAVDRVGTDSIINSVLRVRVPGGTYTIGTPGYIGTGIDDMGTGGTYTGVGTKQYRVEVVTAGPTDDFRWSDNNGATWSAPIAMTGFAQALSDGVNITFAATTGHNTSDAWYFEVTLAGTNYYTGGSYDGRTISLGTNLPGTAIDVLIDYTTTSAITFTEKLLIQGGDVKKLYVTNTSGNTANLYIILSGD